MVRRDQVQPRRNLASLKIPRKLGVGGSWQLSEHYCFGLNGPAMLRQEYQPQHCSHVMLRVRSRQVAGSIASCVITSSVYTASSSLSTLATRSPQPSSPHSHSTERIATAVALQLSSWNSSYHPNNGQSDQTQSDQPTELLASIKVDHDISRTGVAGQITPRTRIGSTYAELGSF